MQVGHGSSSSTGDVDVFEFRWGCGTRRDEAVEPVNEFRGNVTKRLVTDMAGRFRSR